MALLSRATPKISTAGLVEPILDAEPHALLYVDAAGDIQLASARLESFFGLKPSEIIGRPLTSLTESWSRTFAEPVSFSESITHPFHDQVSDFLRDVEIAAPTHRFLEISSQPVGKDGRYAGRLWVMRDVTNEREITELKIRYGGLLHADVIKSKFLTIASHQLRTPMNSMRWNLELLMAEDQAMPPGSHEMLADIYQSVLTSLSIVDDMLLAVDIEQRTLRLEKAPHDIAEVVGKVVRDHLRTAEIRKIGLEFEPPKGLPPLFIDGGKLEKVFSRLMDNALRYTKEGGKVEVSVRAGQRVMEISVRDTGIGISEKERERIFERFYRSERAVEMHPNASGLGLYISRFIVDAHDGTLECVSEEGKGSTFTVTLPLRS
jgi:PAS domain S-box-containing protein